MNMGDRIRDLRIKKGLTQEELGTLIGVQKSAIKKYEDGTVQNIKRSNIQVLANALGVTPSYLMGWDETPESAHQSKAVPTEFYLAARKMGEITEEQRQHIFKQLDSTIDIFLAAKRSAKEEK